MLRGQGPTWTPSGTGWMETLASTPLGPESKVLCRKVPRGWGYRSLAAVIGTVSAPGAPSCIQAGKLFRLSPPEEPPMAAAATANPANLPADSVTAQAPKEVTKGVNPWLIAASVMLATFMEVLDTAIASVALPYIAGSLSASNDEAT